jgi:hypothetical protein
MMLAIVAVCLAAIHLAFDEGQRRQMKRCFGSLIASIKKEGRGLKAGYDRVLPVVPCRLANISPARAQDTIHETGVSSFTG